jgi:hypothetical protein
MKRPIDGIDRNQVFEQRQRYNMDDILIAIIIAGLGLSASYLRAELLLHRRLTRLQHTRELTQRELYVKRVRLGQNDTPWQSRTAPWSIQNAFQAMRVLARELRIFIQERHIHGHSFRT